MQVARPQSPSPIEVEEPAKAAKRKILDVVNPQTGSRVDLSTTTPTPTTAARKREPIPIVDPQSGAKVNASTPKMRGPVAIINPNSGERVVLTAEERKAPTVSDPETPTVAMPSSKPRNPVAIINPKSGEQVVLEAAKVCTDLLPLLYPYPICVQGKCGLHFFAFLSIFFCIFFLIFFSHHFMFYFWHIIFVIDPILLTIFSQIFAFFCLF